MGWQSSQPRLTIGASRNERSIPTLTIKIRPKIGSGEFDHKMEFIAGKLRQGEAIAVRLQLRGMEALNPSQGMDVLRKIAGLVDGIACTEGVSSLSDRMIEMVLVPLGDGPPDSVREPRRPSPPSPPPSSFAVDPEDGL